MRPAEDERLVSQKDVSFGLDHPLRDATVQVGVSGLAVPQGGWDTWRYQNKNTCSEVPGKTHESNSRTTRMNALYHAMNEISGARNFNPSGMDKRIFDYLVKKCGSAKCRKI